MNKPRILVAGIGNIFLGDDAFGVEVVRRLSQRSLPSEVHVADFGIRGLDLAYELLEEHEAVILVDAISRKGTPGTLYVLHPEPADAEPGSEPPALSLLDAHDLNPMNVLALARKLGSTLERVLLVGCEPLTTGDDTHIPDGLSEPVEAAAREAVDLVMSLIVQLRENLSPFETTSSSHKLPPSSKGAEA